MSVLHDQRLNLFLLEKTQWMLTKSIGVANYDFNFQQFFDCHHPYQLPDELTAVARIGAIDNYAEFFADLQNEGITLIHTPEEHFRCSELPNWYPLIADLTPKSIWFSGLPTLEQITAVFDFPIFVKGSRQTSKHQRSLSIIDSEQAFYKALQHYAKDPILHWQNIVCREYVPLRPIQGGHPDKIPASYEFRTFWWKGQFVGAGQYWFQADAYQWTQAEQQAAVEIAREVAQQVNVTFLVVDVAQRTDGTWIVIECNDGQESGYAGLAPLQLWKNILAAS
jgi:hypothetical protein